MQNKNINDDFLLKNGCHELAAKAKQVEVKCRQALQRLAEHHEIYTFKHRVKNPNAIFKKILRKRAEAKDANDPKYTYSHEHVTDAFGCRYVTLFQTDIINLVKDLTNLISGKAVHNIESPFTNNGVKEVLIYSYRPENDPLVIASEVRKIIKSSDIYPGLSEEKKRELEKPPANKKSGYSSIHFIVEVPIDHISVGSEKKELAKVKMEIQIRDIFEEGWGEIQHRLLYKNKDQGVLDATVENIKELLPNEEWWTPHLNALKTVADGCSQHASLIKLNSIEAPQAPQATEQSPITVPIEDMDLVIAALPKDAPSVISETIRDAYQNLSDLYIKHRDDNLSQKDYKLLTSLFEKALETASDYLNITGKHGYSIDYHLSMELALALRGQRDPKAKQEGKEIYKKFHERNPNDPIVLYRYATVLCEETTKDSLNDALDILDHAEKCLKDINFLSEKKSAMLKTAIRVQKGYAYWALGDLLDDNNEKTSFFKQAISISKMALEDVSIDELDSLEYLHKQVVHHAMVNILFYEFEQIVLGYTNIQDALEHSPKLESGDIDFYLEKLSHPSIIDMVMQDLYSRDSLMCIHGLRKDIQDVGELAFLNIEELYAKASDAANAPIQTPLEIPLHLVNDGQKACYSRATLFGQWAIEHGFKRQKN